MGAPEGGGRIIEKKKYTTFTTDRPKGSQGQDLQQDPATRALLVLGPPGAPVVVDVTDRWARLLGTVSPVAGSTWDVSDRAARLLGKIYGDVGVLHQNAASSSFTIEESPTAIVEGQVTMTGAAQQFPADPCKSITIENSIANAVVSIGHDNAVTLLNGYILRPGATVSLAIDNANRVWCIGTAPQIISYIGVN